VDPAGNTARAICANTDTVALGRACIFTARYETPRKNVIATTPIAIRVREAFRACGFRNAVTPFEIDSVPVSATDPDENALSNTKRPSPPLPAGSACGTVACGQAPVIPFTKPTTSTR